MLNWERKTFGWKGKRQCKIILYDPALSFS
ncbi:hypothetical protein ABIC86_002679 [Paenibacillus sp. DS2363]